MACARVAASLLLHVNILLAVLAGAGLATGARLKWDPSTYVAVRELFPREYRLAAAALPAAAAALLLLAHTATLALRTTRRALRRVLLFSYAFLMVVMIAGESALAGWLWARAARWARSPAAAEMQHALRLREHLLPLLQQLAHWHPLPSKIKEIVEEAESDAPRNLHVALAAAALLLLLQALGAALALLAARAPFAPPAAPSAPPAPLEPRRPRLRPAEIWHDHPSVSTPLTSQLSPGGGAAGDKRPPRVVYRGGRLVVCGTATTPHSA